jgi:hypothetical protein
VTKATVREASAEVSAVWRGGDRTVLGGYMFRAMAAPNSEHLISVAPSIRRAKS